MALLPCTPLSAGPVDAAVMLLDRPAGTGRRPAGAACWWGAPRRTAPPGPAGAER